MEFRKWIGGGLGWAFGGPIGAIVGFALGAYLDTANTQVAGSHKTQGGDILLALLVLAAEVVKADGRIDQRELRFVQVFLDRQFGPRHSAQRLQAFQQILQKPSQLYSVCQQINKNLKKPEKLHLLHFMFGLSMSDGKTHPLEITKIKEIAGYLNLSDADFDSLKAMFVKEVDSAYKILEVSKTASDEDVKKAYRKMAMRYHPDKVLHLGEEHQKAAREKFDKVTQAYEEVKTERGIK